MHTITAKAKYTQLKFTKVFSLKRVSLNDVTKTPKILEKLYKRTKKAPKYTTKSRKHRK